MTNKSFRTTAAPCRAKALPNFYSVIIVRIIAVEAVGIIFGANTTVRENFEHVFYFVPFKAIHSIVHKFYMPRFIGRNFYHFLHEMVFV